MSNVKFRNEEELFFNLKKLYEGFGYGRFKMGKFEEYSVYLQNKNFLKSPYVITFTDLNGKLMALKPDVTLSIVKNTKATAATGDKVYYKESVYRPDSSTKEFKEISQVGLEFIGGIDCRGALEVLYLAAKSLESIDGDFVLDISHLGVITGLIEQYCLESRAQEIYGFLTSKNAHDARDFCVKNDIDLSFADKIAILASARGSFEETVRAARAVCGNKTSSDGLDEIEEIYSALKQLVGGDKIRADFSLVNDTDYYNGIVFQGYVSKAPRAVLSGGRYDKLAGKFTDGLCAMGFAVYMDELTMYLKKTDLYDGDVLILDNGNALAAMQKAIELTGQGKTVRIEKEALPSLNFKETAETR